MGRINVKTKGSNAERMYAKIFRDELGFTFCKTSRQSNRMLDDAGIDLNFLPFNVQIKAGYAKGLNEIKTLDIIRERLPEYFPSFDPVYNNVDILIHKKDRLKGQKRKEFGELVFIRTKDFKKLFKIQLTPKEIISIPVKSGQKRGWTHEEILEKSETGFMIYSKDEKQLLVMSFIKFKQLIKNVKWH